ERPGGHRSRSSSSVAAMKRDAPVPLPARRLAAIFRSVVLGSCWVLAAPAGLGCGESGNAATNSDLDIPLFQWDEVAQKPRGPRPHFSFFVTTQQGLFSLGAGQWAPAPDPVHGYGGDLGGIQGADEICSLLAQRSNPGDTKVWRAFLSTTGNYGAPRQDAIDRIGNGPWYDYEGRKLADDL